jgi:hypothetical protein
MDKMIGHSNAQFSGYLSWEDVPIPWKRTLEYVSGGTTVRGVWIMIETKGLIRMPNRMGPLVVRGTAEGNRRKIQGIMN